MLLLAAASGNFPINSYGRALGHSNWGSMVRIRSVKVDLSVTKSYTILKTKNSVRARADRHAVRVNLNHARLNNQTRGNNFNSNTLKMHCK